MEIKKLIEKMSELCEENVKKVTNENFSEIELDAMSKAIDLLFDIMQFPGFTLEEQQQIDQAYLVLKAHHSAETESMDEAKMETDNMLDNIDKPNKIIESDLGFKIRVAELDGGVAFAANLSSNQFKQYKPADHKASKEELAEIVDKCGSVIETKINELEDEIIGIFNEAGYKE